MIKIYLGDCRKTLKTLQEKSVHTCVTSPPYWGLRDYGEKDQMGMEETPEEFVENLVEVFREVKRVLRDDGTVWLNLGDSYGQQNGKGFNTHKNTGYQNRVQKMQAQYGDIKVNTGLPRKNLLGMPWRVAFALQADGWILRQDIIWNKPNPMPESVKDRCTKAHEYIFLLSKQAKYYFDNEAIKEESITTNSKGEKGVPDSLKNIGKSVEDDLKFRTRHGFKNMKPQEKKNKRSVWTVTVKPYKEAHFATYPKELIKPCILAGCPEGGTVLDPFGGSGTTAQIANAHNRNSILCELNADYLKLIEKRLDVRNDMFTDLTVVEV